MYSNLSPRPAKVHVIDNYDKVGHAVETILKYDVRGFDLETYNGFDRTIPAFNPNEGARMRLSQFTTPEGDAFVFDHYNVDPHSFMYHLFPSRATTVIQNAKFECKFLQHEMGIYEFGPIFDTMIAEQVLAKGRVVPSDRKEYIPVGLDNIAKRRLKFDLPKDEQKSDWYKSELSEEQIYYAAMDSTVVLSIWDAQCEALVMQSQMRVAELEFGAVPAYAWMENNGFTLDTEAWIKLAEKNAIELAEVKRELWSLIGTQNTLWDDAPTIKLTSRPQVEMALRNAGIELPVDDEGNVTLNNKLLSTLHEKGKYRVVDLYIRFVKLSKKLSSFGPNWAKFVNPYTGRIHCDLKQIGAETGRSAATSPNLMQIPKENEYRNCFTAREGWVLIDGDYGQCELRILAELCRDPNLLKAFDSHQDIHTYTAHLLYETKSLEDVDKETQRGPAKNTNFLIVYGGGKYKLASTAQVTVEVAEAILNKYLNNVYPGMRDWLNTQKRTVLYNGLKARTMTNRMRQYLGDLNNDEFKAKVQRNAANYAIQGTNADITKLALTQVYREIVKRKHVDVMKLILAVHDEGVGEARPDYALEMQDILTTQMLDAEQQYFQRVETAVDSSISLKWYKDVPEEAKLEAMRLIKT